MLYPDGADSFLDWYHNAGGEPAPVDPYAPPPPPEDALASQYADALTGQQPTIGFPHPPAPANHEIPGFQYPPEIDMGAPPPAPPLPAPPGPPPLPGGPIQPENGSAAPAGGVVVAPPPGVDAISGQPGMSVDAVSGSDPLLDRPDLNALRAQRALDPLSNPDQAEAVADIARMSPEDRAILEYNQKHAGDLEASAKRTDAARENDQRAQDEHKAFLDSVATAQARSRQLDIDSEALANTKIDPEHWWSSRDTGQKIAGIFAAFAGGFNKNGNSAVASMDAAIDRDIDAQKANLANQQAGLGRRRASIGEQLQQAAELEHGAAVFRDASYARIQAQIETERQNYDPMGTQSIEKANLLAEVGARRQAARVAYDDKAQKNALEVNKYNLEVRKQVEVERNNKAVADAKAAKAAGAGAGAVKHPPGYFAALYPSNDVPPIDMSDKDYKSFLGDTKTGKEIEKTRQEIVTGNATRSKEELEHGVSDLKQADGKTPFVAQGDAGAVSDLRKSVSSTRTLVRLMDEALALRTGWTSNTNRSEEWQQLQANWKNAVGVAGQVLGLGALSDEDFKLAAGFIGTDDPTQYRDPTPGIKKARENVIRMTRDRLESAAPPGGVKFDIPYIAPKAPEPSVSDKAYLKAQQKPTETTTMVEYDQKHPEVSGERYDPSLRYADQVSKGDEPTLANVIPAETRSYLADLQSLAKAGGDKGRDAVTQLKSLVDTGGNAAIRNLASSALLELGSTPIDETTYAHQAAGQRVAHEEAPPRPALEPNKPRKGHR